MSHNLTEVVSFDSPIVVPDDGDDLLVASVNDPFQRIADRTQWLRQFPSGLMWGRAYLASSNGTQVDVGGFQGLSVNGSWMNSAAVVTLTPTLAASTWYYIYAYDQTPTSGTLGFEVSTTGPAASTYTFKAGDTSRVYLGCFRTDGSSKIVPFRRSPGGHYVYRVSGGSPFYGHAALGFGATAWTTLSLAQAVPPHVRLIDLRMTSENASTTSTNTFSVRTTGDTLNSVDLLIGKCAAAGVNVDATITVPIETDGSQQIDYTIANASTFTTIDVLGFYE